MLDRIKTAFKILFNVAKDEVEEIRNLQPTEDDYTQGEVMGSLAIATMAAMGVPTAAVEQEVIARVCAYALRDLKDGIQSDNKLIIHRVINEIKEAKASKNN